nr:MULTISPECIES: LysR family transcriptional regulator [unclassified Paenibacillus]
MKYFQTVARLEHMTRAAEELFLSQPSLSKIISNLEKELSVKLFDRTGKHIKLNEYGKSFLSKVDLALATLEDAKREMVTLSTDISGNIDIAALCGMPLLAELLVSFRKEYPRVKFNLSQFTLNSQLPATFNLYISATPIILQGSTTIPLMTEKICLGVPENHRLAKRSSIKLREIANDEVISLRLGTSIRYVSDIICKEAGFTPNISIESNDPSTVRKLIREGQGVAFIPKITWKDVIGDVVLLDIDEPSCQRTLEMTWITNRYSSSAEMKFRDYIIEYFT